MKKIYQITLLIFITCFLSVGVKALHIKTQAELDAFVLANPNLAEYSGDLIIGANLTYEWGIPTGNTDIDNLSGLKDLKKVNGDFYLIKFKGNDLTELSALKEVTGSFIISGAPMLKNLSGLNKLNSVGIQFIVSHNVLMEDISGLVSGVNVAETVVIDSNETMLTLNGYENITCQGTLMFCFNPSMTDISAIQGVSEVKGLGIFNNDEIEELSVLSELTTVTEKLSINDNPKLFTLDGLENLESVTRLEIYNNPSLYDCDAKGICKRLKEGNLINVLIVNNKEGCNSTTEVNCVVGNENVGELERLISISPNPASGNIRLDIPQVFKIQNINILNSVGKVIQVFEEYNGVIDVSSLAAGMYYMRLNVDNQMVTKKLIIE